MTEFTEEFRDVLGLYAKLTADLTRIADVGESDDDPQALIKSIINNQDCLTEIQQLNERLTKLYGTWRDRETDFSLTVGNEIRGVVDDVRGQMQQLEKLCGVKSRRIEDWRKELSEELAKVGKGSKYAKMINPIQENYPKFIDSAG